MPGKNDAGSVRRGAPNAWHVIRWAFGAALLFLAVTQFLLLVPAAIAGRELVPLSAGDTVALMVGAVTAAALSAIYLQIREARRSARRSAVDAALRADQLHAEFNSSDMRLHRERAFEYIQYLRVDPERFATFASAWLSQKNEAGMIPDGSSTSFSAYQQSVSCMVAFFSRVELHVQTHNEEIEESGRSEHVVLGPFFWSYWAEAGLSDLVAACEQAWDRRAKANWERPYFIEPLKSLALRYESVSQPPGE